MYTDKAACDNGLCVYTAKCGPCFFKSNTCGGGPQSMLSPVKNSVMQIIHGRTRWTVLHL